MDLLRILTLIYAVVLVLALAVSLIIIWMYLRRIAGSLSQTRATLESVGDTTRSLDDHFQRLQDESVGASAALIEALGRLRRVEDRFAVLAEQSGATELTR
jgi:methyl-accepting chemotaxis protein